MVWQQVYSSGVARCGDGEETQDEGSACMQLTAPYDAVTPFYQKQNHSYCIKARFVKKPEKLNPWYWCYVSSLCKSRRGGKQVNEAVSVKRCGDGDATLADLSPGRLFQVTAPADVELAVLLAYRFEGPDESSPLENLTDPLIPAVGNSGTFDIFNVLWHDQKWEVSERAECVKGCPSQSG